MSIKSWIIIFTNCLLALTIGGLSFLFYIDFNKALNERVLLQLMSIKRLKRLQIENYLKEEWVNFQMDSTCIPYHKNTLPIDEKVVDSIINSPNAVGVYDMTAYSKDGKLLLVLVKKVDGKYCFRLDNALKIQQILLERTGMGQSGETYLVGDDYQLRSESRFFTEKSPYSIQAKTKGVISAIKNVGGKKIIKDYRNIEVYSAFHPISFSHIKWAILSEIDVKEVNEPLIVMRNKILLTSISILVIVVFISFFLTTKFTKPIQKVSGVLSKMAEGQYGISTESKAIGKEVNQLYEAVRELQNSLLNAIAFSNEIGKMNLKVDSLSLKSQDPLSKSLIAMRDKLIEFQEVENISQQRAKQALIEGQENERSRLSKELHDGLGPLLTSLKLKIQTSNVDEEQKRGLKNLIDTTIVEVRRMSYNLMPQSLIDFGVGKAVLHWVELVQETTDIKIYYENSMFEIPQYKSREIDICLFRVIQELLNNSIKHSKATEIRLSLTEFEDKICLYYFDNGIGFDPQKPKKGSGVKNIKERIDLLNGYIILNSRQQNTEIEVELPIKPTL